MRDCGDSIASSGRGCQMGGGFLRAYTVNSYNTVTRRTSMNRKPVSSSDLSSVGYDSASSTLEIEFKDGSIYQYFAVPPDAYTGLMAALSHGTYFSRHIKNRGYRYRKVS